MEQRGVSRTVPPRGCGRPGRPAGCSAGATRWSHVRKAVRREGAGRGVRCRAPRRGRRARIANGRFSPSDVGLGSQLRAWGTETVAAWRESRTVPRLVYRLGNTLTVGTPFGLALSDATRGCAAVETGTCAHARFAVEHERNVTAFERRHTRGPRRGVLGRSARRRGADWWRSQVGLAPRRRRAAPGDDRTEPGWWAYWTDNRTSASGALTGAAQRALRSNNYGLSGDREEYYDKQAMRARNAHEWPDLGGAGATREARMAYCFAGEDWDSEHG